MSRRIITTEPEYEDIAIESLVRSYDHLCRKKCVRKNT